MRIQWIYYHSFCLTGAFQYVLSSLNVQQVGNQIVLFSDLLRGLDDEECHFLHSKVVRNSRIKSTTQFCQQISLVVLNCVFQISQNFVSLKYGLARKLAKWHLLNIDVYRDNALLHHLLIEEEFN